jgi:hypothetical protein
MPQLFDELHPICTEVHGIDKAQARALGLPVLMYGRRPDRTGFNHHGSAKLAGGESAHPRHPAARHLTGRRNGHCGGHLHRHQPVCLSTLADRPCRST